MSISAMKQALEALELEDLACRYEKDPTPEHIADAITALRTAIAEAEKQEPVAWQGLHDQTDLYYRKPPQTDVRPLYTAPVMSEKHGDFLTKDRHEFFCPRCGHCCKDWVGLTDEEIKALSSWWPSYDQMPALMTLARDIENSLKEKNT